LKASGKIQKGKIIFDNKADFISSIAKMEDGIKIIIEVREAKDIRTNSQNRLWWKWMEIISSEIGYEKQEIHDILKYKFLLREEMIDGEMHQNLKSTTTLTKKEFNKLTQDVFYWANDTFNINLPND
jgi:hypothetical protein|tara:strand:+ start:242 stop:622 length:381 start_codon:yes stop_codon:yes gene_type:complete